MESIEENKMCRLCLQSNESLIDIFKVNNNSGYVAAELIEDLMELQVSKKDHYPQFICEKCLEKLIEFKNFKTQGHISKATYDNVFAADGDKDQEEVVIVKAEPLVRVYDDEREDKCSYQDGPNGKGMGDMIAGTKIHPHTDIVQVKQESFAQNESSIHVLDGESLDTGIYLTNKEEHKKVEKDHSASKELNFVVLPSEKCRCICREEEKNSYRNQLDNGASCASVEKILYKCQQCIKMFSTESNYIVHNSMHSDERHFYCGICGKTFVCKDYLDLHMRDHGDKPYSCLCCDKKFSHKCRLDSHMKSHSLERPFACSICEKKFKNREGLNYHVRTHTGEKPFSCFKCHKKFAGRYNLSVHMKAHKK